MSPSTATVAYPLIAGVIYVFSALFIKRTADFGVGLWRTTFVVNIVAALIFSILWTLGGKPVELKMLWQPLAIALMLFSGQLCQFFALEKGDISVAVPVFGLKVILVAFFTPLLIGESVGLPLWIAAFLSVAGVTLLNRRHEGKSSTNIGITLVAGGMGAVCFALFDVLVQKWAPAWGIGRLLPLIFGINSIFSFALIPMFKSPLREMPRAVWKPLLLGSVLLGGQSVIFVSTIAIYGHATAANIAYSSRGLWSVVLVWLVGHWFHNQEQHLGHKVMRWRLAGSALMMTAIVLVILR